MDWPKEKIRVAVVEEHDKALHHLYKGIGCKRVPFSGLTMVHFDAHPDLTLPEIDAETAFMKEDLFHAISIESWIAPAVLAGHVNHVVWLRPDWANQMADGEYDFGLGFDPVTGLLRTSCPLTYFLEDGVFLASDHFRDDLLQKRARLTVCDFDFQPGEQRPQWLLDIDLDTFSTADPFRDYFDAEALDLLQQLYSPRLQCPHSDAEVRRMTTDKLEQISSDRAARLEVLRDLAEEVDGGAKAEAPEDLRTLFSRLLQLCKHRSWLQDALRGGSDGPAGFLHYLLSGYSPGALPHKPAKDSSELRALVTGRFRDALHRLCEAWGPPCLVTIARSTRDGYCPPQHVELLQELVLQEIRGELQSPIDLRLEEG